MVSIVDEFHSLLRDYLDHKILEDDVRDWIGGHIGNPPDEIVPLFYDVTLAMWDMEAGCGTEDDFRASIVELLAEEGISLVAATDGRA